jgi:predicted nucleic acid-binding protein
VTALVDTNLLVYRFDPRDARKQSIATSLLREGIANGSIRVPHQAILEFVAAVTRPIGVERRALLQRDEALREAEAMLSQFDVLYPTESVVRLAVRGALAYQLPWFDAHIWAYAEHYGLNEIVSEDFSDGRMIGRVRIRDPFRGE